MIPFVSGRTAAKPIIAALLFITLAFPVFFYSLGLLSSGGVQAAASPITGGNSSRAYHAPPKVPSTSLVISQVYGGGGNSGAPWHNDFIEIFNKGSAPVDVSGWSVQYGSATGSSWQVTQITAGSVPPGGYFLVQEAAGSGGGDPLPTPDAVGTLAMSSTAAKIALVNNSTALTGSCPTGSSLIDLVGYGLTANCFEGTGATAAPSNSTSVVRLGEGCTDTDDNASDFLVATTITPRNSASPRNPCAGGGSPTVTITPGGSTNTVTITPGGATNTTTRTPIPTMTLEPSSGVLIYMLHYTQYDTSTVGIGDEAVRLLNSTPDAIFISGWRISNGIGYIQLPSPVLLQSHAKIWIANRATTFRRWFGFNPDYEYGADTDPNVPQATATNNYSFVDAGGVITLMNQSGGPEDTLVYKAGTTPSPGWSGPSVLPYLPTGQPAFTESGQIFYRKLDQSTGLPVPDTNTKDDWAQDDDPTGSSPTPGREFDDVNAKRLLRPGMPLTDPSNEDMFFTKNYTDTNVTTKFFLDPDNGFDSIHQLLLSATQAITIETYEWHNLELAQDVINAKNRGVLVNAFFDGNPCCTNLPDNETLWTAQQWENVGIPVYFWSGSPATGDDTYRYANMHQKIMVVDRHWVVTGSDNFTYTSFPSDNKANGTAGNRGATVMTNAPDVVAYTLRLIASDSDIRKYPDLVRYPGLGTPPPGYAPTPFPDMVGYTVIKPTPLVVTETENIEIIQSPDNALRDQDSIIGMVNKAGPGDDVMVAAAYERKYWESSTTNGPNPRVEAYIRAARRGANVRVLLDGFFEGGDCTSSTHNPATAAYINGIGLPNLQARLGIPTGGYPMPTGTPASSPTITTGNIHAARVFVSTQGGTKNYVSIASLNGSLNSAKNNREYGLQIQSNAAYQYYKDAFDIDWSRGYLTCGAVTSTPTPVITGTPPTATQTPLACNLLANPGFETGSLGPWTTTTPGITAQIVSTPVNSGSFAIAVTSVFTVGSGGSQGLQQNIDNILGGATYRISAAVLRSAANITSARIRITWYPCPNQGCTGTNDDMFLGNNDPSWQTISAMKTAPTTAMSAKFKPVFYTSDGNPATIYFDDLVFDCNGNATATPGAGTATAVVTPTSATSTTPARTLTTTPLATSTPPLATLTMTPTMTPTRTRTPGITPTPSNCGYTYLESTGSLAGGTTDIGNHCDDCATQINLPFAFQLYDRYFTTAQIGANGYVQFVQSNTVFNSCLPAPGLTYTILPYFDDLKTDCPGCGIFTSVMGTAPNRWLCIEWRATDTGGNNDFEVRLYEGSPSVFQVVYGTVARHGLGSQVGVQKDDSTYTQYSCATSNIQQGLKITFVRNCGEPVFTPTATYTSTSVSSTSTPVYTPSPVATVPSCSINFSDMQPEDDFYLSVRYLYCRGVVSGYSDRTFHPYDNTTRSQLTKIIVLSMNWPVDTSGGPHFSDVPASHGFYAWVETAYHHQAISGYSDGTFHPSGSVTRGQVAKVVVMAMHWLITTSGGPHFTDVPESSPLYRFIETAYNYGVIRGYSDHTFHPNDNVTRSQISVVMNMSLLR